MAVPEIIYTASGARLLARPGAPEALEIAVDLKVAKGKIGASPRPGYKISAQGETAEILIYEDIGDSFFGGVSAKQFVQDLNRLSDDVTMINLRINSFGGSVFDGFAIYNALLRHAAKIEVDIDGIAASAASFVAMAGDEIRIAENAMLMIHEPWSFAFGTAEDMRREANLLDQISGMLVATYAARSDTPLEEITTLMAAETWFTAEEAVAQGLADVMSEEMKVAAHGDASRFKNLPSVFAAQLECAYDPVSELRHHIAVQTDPPAVEPDPFWTARVQRQTAQLARTRA